MLDDRWQAIDSLCQADVPSTKSFEQVIGWQLLLEGDLKISPLAIVSFVLVDRLNRDCVVHKVTDFLRLIFVIQKAEL